MEIEKLTLQSRNNEKAHGESTTKPALIILAISFLVRLFLLSHPAVVVFDEVHFGGFARKYLNRVFFFDVHPPLAKLLVAFSGLLGNLGDFTFERIGVDYLEPKVPYVLMRSFPALLGAVVPVLCYLTLCQWNIRKFVAMTCSTMLIFENAFFTQSRLILLDSYLVFFTTLTVYFWSKFQNSTEFSASWWKSLAFEGFSLGCALSCKWVGLFLVATVGLNTLFDLFKVFTKAGNFMKHFAARFLCLVVVPLTVYTFTFYVQFLICYKYTSDAGMMSIGFTQTLEGGKIEPTYKDVMYGSIVTIRQVASGGAYLHSHPEVWPAGSEQQQVTAYPHRDVNNEWIIRSIPREEFKPEVPAVSEQAEEEVQIDESLDLDSLPEDINRKTKIDQLEEPEEHVKEDSTGISSKKPSFDEGIAKAKHMISRLRNGESIESVNASFDLPTEIFDENTPVLSGSVIRLEHKQTTRYLHSHNVEAPISEKDHHFEVSGYGSSKSFSDTNDHWRIDLCDKYGNILQEKKFLEPTMYFRLTHVNLGCGLHTSRKTLPDYAFKQQEVTCGHETLKTNMIWVIETNRNPEGSGEKISFKENGFWSNFIELHQVMWKTNKALSADHPFASRPLSWFLLSRGLGFWNGKDPIETGEVDGQKQYKKQSLRYKNQQIHLIGNPIVWFIASCTVALAAFIFLGNLILEKRQILLVRKDSKYRFTSIGGFLLLGWAFHFFPFFLMTRQLFLHHYLPAYYFAILLVGLLLHSLFNAAILLKTSFNSKISVLVVKGLLVLLLTCSIYTFYRLSPLGYGTAMSKERCEAIKWRNTWDFDCDGLESELVVKPTD